MIACLSAVGLKDEATAWAFVRDEGLVRDAPGDREQFCEVVRELRENEITGPSPWAQISRELMNRGMTLKAAAERDPNAETARAHLEQWRASASRRK
ncbi:hypothetical protein [Hyalangium rubrum]|uniref:Uncharacterized protein n=1 Tax=Hyalangium rubrum TaxID=3103134 RepID=A0ABU5H407_9BACT|nr:hypothetical protein [Hyalangium sp. s54d21]MDY7228090.1 hypothetical protein [Hyalangium sp. s54d21]